MVGSISSINGRPGVQGQAGRRLRGQRSHNLHRLEHIRQDIGAIPTPPWLPQGLLQGLGHVQELWCGKFPLGVQLTEQNLIHFPLDAPDIQEGEHRLEPTQH